MIRKAVRILVTACLIVFTSLNSAVFSADAAVPVVQDTANVLSAEQKSELEQYGIQLNNATTAELAVLILPSIGDKPVEEYAVEKLREFKLGNKEKNNGALLVVTTEKNSDGNRHFELSVGYGLEGALPDGKVGSIMDEVAVPYLNKQQPDMAIMEAYKSFYNEIAAEYGWDGADVPITTIDSDSSDGGFGIPFPVILFIIIYIVFRVISNRGGRGGGGGSGGRRSGGPIFFPGSFGGRSGGGSSGGGFGGFGGGGSGGGGGAGRSW
ncbi:TPM domain-containing protein [Sporosarcina psychrophila]|uniref:TPM domain-containing protein n=1 Tax=Sporosarcina psychrophila TaxID=1476 RepID=UPI003BA084EC